ncbi:MAG TPA: PAS domain S-box protein [Longimicrobium sp.]|nr:PAS domain S-box protein [Longimicrobium sp.]
MNPVSPARADTLSRQLVDALRDEAVFALDPAGRVASWNEGARAITGYAAEEAMGRHFSVFFPAEEVSLGMPERELRRAVQAGRTESEGWRVRKDGTRFWAHTMAAALHDEEGRHTGFAKVIRDITERIRAEEMLRLSEARFSGIISIATDAIVSVDEGQRIVLFNQGAERIFGWAEAEIRGLPLSTLLPERVHDRHEAHLRHFAAAPVVAKRMGERQEIFGRRKDGSEFPAEASISRLEVGGQRFFTAVLRDITERKEAERLIAAALEREQAARAEAEAAEHRTRFLAEVGAELTRSLEREATLRTLARVAVPTLADWALVFIAEEDGAVRRLEVAHRDPEKEGLARALVGIPVDRASAHPVLEALRTREPVLREDLAPGYVDQVAAGDEHRRVLEALDMRQVLVVPLVLRDAVLGALGLVMSEPGRRFDAAAVETARELATRAAVAVENARLYGAAQAAVRAREDVLHVVSHDLGNSLSAIVVTTTVLLRTLPEGEGNAELRKRISSIRDLARRMQRLRQDLLDVASIESGRLGIEWDRWDPAGVAREALEAFAPLAAEKGVALEDEVSDGLPALEGDRERVLQVLANLLGNAVKFTPAGGRVTLRVEPGDDEVRFAVADTGPGIPPEHLGHVFDRFWKVRAANRTGAGLGLAIARGIVEAHDGRIWVDSTLGEGSTFYFTLPLRPEEEVEE